MVFSEQDHGNLLKTIENKIDLRNKFKLELIGLVFPVDLMYLM